MDVSHLVVDARGTRMHVVVAGDGPLVLLVHGFPESWYSWRYQIPALTEAGFRVAAIDVRGYGRSAHPHPVEEYRMLRHVSDNLGVVEELGAGSAVLVGHDWGSPIAATSALLRPDIFPAVALLSVPYSPPGGRRPSDVFAQMAGPDDEFYISYFQREGVAEAEIELDVRSWVAGVYLAWSGANPAGRPSPALVPRGATLRSILPLVGPEDLLPWLTPADLDFYVAEFEHGGLRGPLNRYRNLDRDWVDLQPWRNRPITVPSLYIGGEKDGPVIWGARAIERHPETLPGLSGNHILAGCGHWVQQEAAAEVNRLLLDWLESDLHLV